MVDDTSGVNPAEYVLSWHPLTGGESFEVPLYDFITGMEDELGEFHVHTREVTAEGVTTRPILRRVDCGEGCPVTWAEVPEGVPGGCPWCSATYHREAHALCDHKGHGRWRSARFTKWLAGKGYSLGVLAGYGIGYGGGCPGCISGFRWRGRRSYALGWSVDNWRCLLRGHHWPGEQVEGFCTKCLPCPTCKSEKAAHNPGCADDAWAGRSCEDGAAAGTPNQGDDRG